MKELKAENLTFVRGDEKFTPEEFVKAISPYFRDLTRVKRTNFLFVAVTGDGKKHVTGYSTDTTINATVNSRVLEVQKTGGKWAIYKLG